MQGLVEVSQCGVGVAVILHSTSGTLETGVQNILAEVCRAQGLTVVRFDARHGLNEDGARFIDFTVSTYREDLEDVLAWARTQPWWTGGLTLVGHSSGALVASLYATEHPGDVRELVLLTPTTSGQAYLDAFEMADPSGLDTWREQRLRTVRHPLSGECFSLSYGFVEDLLRYDIMSRATTLTMPTLVLSGESDVTTPHEVCAELVRAIGQSATLLSVPGMRHTPEHHDELRNLADALYRHMKS
jgi:pimeloyl-ACP methyl ester carboxylesterase